MERKRFSPFDPISKNFDESKHQRDESKRTT